LDEEKPGHAVVAFDTHHPTFRHERFGAYKGNRVAMPDELRPQIALVKEVLAAMGICISECPGFEADDIIGTLAAKAEADGYSPVMVSGDKDLLQLVTEKTKLRLPRTKAGQALVDDFFAEDVRERMGVSPRAYIDVKALMGDSSDNIPGVPGIGEVTATKIIAAYGSLEEAISHAAEIKPKKASENLTAYEEQARLSKELATISTNAPVTLEPDKTILGELYNKNALEIFKRLELKNFYPRFKKEKTKPPVTVIENPFEADDFLGALTEAAFYILADGDSWAGIAFAGTEKPPVYIPIEYITMGLLKEWFESPAGKYAYDSKRERLCLHAAGIKLQGLIFDAMLAGYVLNESVEIPDLENVLNNKGKKGRDRRRVNDLSLPEAAGFAGGVAEAVAAAYPLMTETLTKNGQKILYEEIELPLAHVLADMEIIGIQVNPDVLTEYESKLDERLLKLTKTIHETAGEDFNIQSPAQLGHILFDKLGLKGTKKTTQGFSTSADVLEKLANQHPIIPLVLEYRAHAKLKSTYVDGLLAVIDKKTQRVHSTFHQALTATGRLSSAEPNLQNIPVRMPLGRELRRAFIAPDADTVLMEADYSQIELRILAHMAGDDVLIDAYNKGMDIHRLTASQVLHIPPEEVTPEQRNSAKAVNFGIVYGISAFGLSEDLKIPKQEAEAYIKSYFEKYPKIKIYLDESIARAKKDGFAATLFGRRRPIPELFSSNFNQRGFGERVAMNMPIQGTAADIIKIAMLKVWERLKREKAASRLILQVHDALLLEVDKRELEAVSHIVKYEMENAVKLSVPLTVETGTGNNWYETK
jgi:DNA polymerase-1